MKTVNTKEAAAERLVAAGYNAAIQSDGLFVKGGCWEAFFADSGQDHNTYSGNVPFEVDELAVWDDEEAREPIPLDGVIVHISDIHGTVPGSVDVSTSDGQRFRIALDWEHADDDAPRVPNDAGFAYIDEAVQREGGFSTVTWDLNA